MSVQNENGVSRFDEGGLISELATGQLTKNSSCELITNMAHTDQICLQQKYARRIASGPDPKCSNWERKLAKLVIF